MSSVRKKVVNIENNLNVLLFETIKHFNPISRVYWKTMSNEMALGTNIVVRLNSSFV